MSNLLHKLKKVQLKKYLVSDKSISRKSIFIGSLVATLVASTPFLFNLHNFVPDTAKWTNWLFTYDSVGYENAQIGIWLILSKLIPIMLLILWFFTCRHWWYHVILIPIITYIIQLFFILDEETNYFDDFQLMYLVPIMSVIIPSIYLIRAQMFNKLNEAGKTMEELEAEFMIKPTTLWGKVKQFF